METMKNEMETIEAELKADRGNDRAKPKQHRNTFNVGSARVQASR